MSVHFWLITKYEKLLINLDIRQRTCYFTCICAWVCLYVECVSRIGWCNKRSNILGKCQRTKKKWLSYIIWLYFQYNVWLCAFARKNSFKIIVQRMKQMEFYQRNISIWCIRKKTKFVDRTLGARRQETVKRWFQIRSNNVYRSMLKLSNFLFPPSKGKIWRKN